MILAKVENLKPIAEEAGLGLAQMALAWCLRRPEVSSVIMGASSPEQVKENVRASGVVFSESMWESIDEVLADSG